MSGLGRPVLWAADDRVVPLEHGRRYADRFGAELRDWLADLH